MTDNVKTGKKRELPVAFIEEMKELFTTLPGVSVSELPAFLESLQKERSYGLRRNPLKLMESEFEETLSFLEGKIPWAKDGYFYNKNMQPGKSPYHEAGAFYIQEPSAMIAAELLDAKPGERVADLCAAPGGKSTQIAGQMKGEGLLVCNEYVPARAEILAQNMERIGVTNCIILKESVDRMAERFSLFFDKVLVDAPCSGSGMFRKEEQAFLQWSPENVAMCAKRQQEILGYAAGMVKPGGVLVYSTCTFSKAENEDVIRWFLTEHPEFYADETVLSKEFSDAGVCPGGLSGTVRMWPHRLRGEGHFAARFMKEGAEREKNFAARFMKEGTEREKNFAAKFMKEETDGEKNFAAGLVKEGVGWEKRGEDDKAGRGRYGGKEERPYQDGREDKACKQAVSTKKPKGRESASEQENRNFFQEFSRQYFSQGYQSKLEITGVFIWERERLFWMPKGLPELGNLRNLRIERGGLYLGEAKKGRFEPSHTWAMTLKKEDVAQFMEVEDAAAYLRGETVENKGCKGWTLLLFSGIPLGWGKAVGNVVKNHYPKGLRISSYKMNDEGLCCGNSYH